MREMRDASMVTQLVKTPTFATVDQLTPTSGFLGARKFILKTFSTPKNKQKNNPRKRTSSQKPIDHDQTRLSTVLPRPQLPYPDHPKQQEKEKEIDGTQLAGQLFRVFAHVES